MSGVVALRSVFLSDDALIVLVPSTSIGAGVLPQDTPLPGIALESVSSGDRNIPNPGGHVHVTDRVQATILAKSYDSLLAIRKAVRRAVWNNRFPTIAGLLNVTVHTISAGPDFMNEDASIYLGSHDFRVTYSEAR